MSELDYLLTREQQIVDRIGRLEAYKADVLATLQGISHLVGTPFVDSKRAEAVELVNEIEELQKTLRVLRVDIGCPELRRFFGDDYYLMMHNTKLTLWVNRDTKVEWLQYNSGLQHGYREPKPIAFDYSAPVTPYANFETYEYQFQRIVKDNIRYLIGGNEEVNKVIISKQAVQVESVPL